MKKIVLTAMIAVAAVAVAAKGVDMPKSNDKPVAAAKAPVVHTHVVTEQMMAEREKRRAEMREKIAAMSEKERKAYFEERRKRRDEAREKFKNSPRRVVKRTRSEDGTITIERADGTVEVHKVVRQVKGEKAKDGSGGK